jgi:hypothetical protein
MNCSHLLYKSLECLVTCENIERIHIDHTTFLILFDDVN